MTIMITLLHRAFAVIGGVALALLLFVTVLDIVLRTVGTPLSGAYETIGWLAAVSMGSALAYTQAHKGHIAIDLLLARFPRRTRLATEACTSLLGALLMGVATWQLVIYANGLYVSGSLSQTLRVPTYPWVYMLACGVGVLTLVIARDVVEAVTALRRDHGVDRGAAP